MSGDRNQQLEVKNEDGVLNISIGVDLLVHAITQGSDFWPEDELTVTDADVFASEIARELESEQEDGTTIVHLMLDKAAENALNNGCEGVDEIEDTES